MVTVGVWSKSKTSPAENWLYREACVRQSVLNIDFFKHELYEIKVTVTNNENISATSETVDVDLRTSESYH